LPELTTTPSTKCWLNALSLDSQREFRDAGHELRNPITDSGTPGNAENNQTARDDHCRMDDELNRMSRLVSRLAVLAKAERADFLNQSLEELDWLTEELYLCARALESSIGG